MRGRFGLSLGFPISRNLPLLAFSLFALIACPDITRAQDVIAPPQSTDASSSTPAIFSTNTAAAPEAPPDVMPPPPQQLARKAPAPGLTESPIPDQPTKQCTTDADCVLSDGGCRMVEAVNKNKHAAWRTQVARSQPGCVGLPAPAMQQLQQALTPVCRENICGLQVVKAGK